MAEFWGSQASQHITTLGDLTYSTALRWVRDFNTLPPADALRTMPAEELSTVVADECFASLLPSLWTNAFGALKTRSL